MSFLDAVLRIPDNRHGARPLAGHVEVPGNRRIELPASGQLDPLDDLPLRPHRNIRWNLGHVRTHHVHAQGGHKGSLKADGDLQVDVSLYHQHMRRGPGEPRLAEQGGKEVDVVRACDGECGKLNDRVPAVKRLNQGHAEQE